MRRIAPLVLVLLGGMLFAVGCGGGKSNSTTAQLRMVNTISGGDYDTLVGGTSFTTGLTFDAATAYASVTSGAETIEVRNTGTATDLIDQSVSLTGADSYTYIIEGGTVAVPFGGNLYTDTTTAASSGDVELRIIDASSVLTSIDVYFVPSSGNCGTYLNGVSAQVANLEFGSGSGYKTLTDGSYQICITPAGSKAAVYLGGTTAYASGAVETIVIEDNGGSYPLILQTLTDATASSS